MVQTWRTSQGGGTDGRQHADSRDSAFGGGRLGNPVGQYGQLPGLGALGYQHDAVSHSEGVYVLGKDIHTNSVEEFWSQLKRSIDGSYHHVTT